MVPEFVGFSGLEKYYCLFILHFRLLQLRCLRYKLVVLSVTLQKIANSNLIKDLKLTVTPVMALARFEEVFVLATYVSEGELSAVLS